MKIKKNIALIYCHFTYKITKMLIVILTYQIYSTNFVLYILYLIFQDEHFGNKFSTVYLICQN